MQITQYVEAVENIFSSIDNASLGFLDKARLKCPSGCDKCCHGKDIAASPLEYLPYSYNLFVKNQLEETYWKFKGSKPQHCFFLNSDPRMLKGGCSEYRYRGIVCRLFGNGAIIKKNGEKAFSACGILKGAISNLADFDLVLQNDAPVYSDYYMQLRAIDNTYGGMLCNLNDAILKAMEIVYYNTRTNETDNYE